jgi:hypothetical protein
VEPGLGAALALPAVAAVNAKPATAIAVATSDAATACAAQPDLAQPDLDQPDLDRPDLGQPDLDRPGPYRAFEQASTVAISRTT